MASHVITFKEKYLKAFVCDISIAFLSKELYFLVSPDGWIQAVMTGSCSESYCPSVDTQSMMNLLQITSECQVISFTCNITCCLIKGYRVIQNI